MRQRQAAAAASSSGGWSVRRALRHRPRRRLPPGALSGHRGIFATPLLRPYIGILYLLLLRLWYYKAAPPLLTVGAVWQCSPLRQARRSVVC
jgi:hypothetical protein